jgi:hypothetical protein
MLRLTRMRTGGNEEWDDVLVDQGEDDYNENSNVPLPAGQNTFSTIYEEGSVQGTFNDTSLGTGNGGYYGTYQQSASSDLMIEPTGQAGLGQTNVYLLLVSTAEYSNIGIPVLNFIGDTPRPPEWTRVNGDALVDTGLTNSVDGAIFGAALIEAPSGANAKVKFASTGAISKQLLFCGAASDQLDTANTGCQQ